MKRPPIKAGDVITGPAGGEQWTVTSSRGLRIEIMREVTDSRGVSWIERREVWKRDVRVVGSQVELGL
jgi:hypothetical protein